jgi:hypothetical protein
MKRLALPELILTLLITVGAWAAIEAYSTASLADSIPAVNSDSSRNDASVPLTDRVPWLIYVVLTSSSAALAWILFSLARNSRRQGQEAQQPQEQEYDETGN